MIMLNRGLRELAWWLLPLAAAATILGAEVRWSRTAAPVVAASEAVAVRPAMEPGLLPEYSIPGGIDSRRETVDRTLFNPTRRPSPPPAQPEPAKPRMQRGQFVLTGTTVVDGKSTAFLREVNGGKARRVHQGETINGLVVAEVKSDRVKLTMGDESEELVLRVIANPKPTPGAPVQQAAAPPPAAPGQPMPVPQQPSATVAAGNPDPNVQALIERRRALRALQQMPMDDDPDDPKDPRTIAAQQAARAAAGQQQAAPAPVPTPVPQAAPMPAPAQGATNPLTFEEMYRRRFQQR